MEATMHEAKSGLSQLVARAAAGEEVILTTGKARIPVARIVPIIPSEASVKLVRPLGLFAGEMGTDSGYDWSEPMSEEELALWEAPIVSNWKNNSGEIKSGEIEVGKPGDSE